MTADIRTASLTTPDIGKLVLPSYERPSGLHPPLDFDGYRSTALRHPKQPLVLLPHRLTEVTGPLLGEQLITATDADLTTQHDGEPQGQRIILTGRVLDSDGRPVPDTLIVCSGAVVDGSTARVERGDRDGSEVAARKRLTPIPTAISRARVPGVGMVKVVDIWLELLSDCRRGMPV